ncbi:MAG: hypothetical protein ChlgKO_08670 [Chlamydiales bacterium]
MSICTYVNCRTVPAAVNFALLGAITITALKVKNYTKAFIFGVPALCALRNMKDQKHSVNIACGVMLVSAFALSRLNKKPPKNPPQPSPENGNLSFTSPVASQKKIPRSNLNVAFISKEDVEMNRNTDKLNDFRTDLYKNRDEQTLLNEAIRNLVIQFLKENRGSPVYKRLFLFWPFPETNNSILEIVAKRAYNELNQTTKKEVIFVRDSQS